MSLTISILLAAWLGLNAAFVAVRYYITVGQTSPADGDLVRYPRDGDLVRYARPVNYPRLVN
jgi:hypothetical protein